MTHLLLGLLLGLNGLLLAAQHSVAEEGAVSNPQSPAAVPPRSSQRYPSLDERPLEVRVEPVEAEQRVWEHALPFFAQDVIDLGYDLPNPYGVALVPNWVRQDLDLDNLAVNFNNRGWQGIDFVDFGTPSIENKNVQAKFDAWIFPFLNAYITLGKMRGEGEIPITLQGGDLLELLGISCDGILSPDACLRTFSAMAEPDYKGDNISLGINLAMGWEPFFVTLPITYTWSDVDIIEDTVESIFISPRFGVTADVGNMGLLAVFAGASYLDADMTITGKFNFDTSGVPGLGDTTTLDYRIDQSNKDRWNYLIGFNWDISKTWSVQAELGTGGSRDNAIASVTYRF